MKFSNFGRKFTDKAGILSLMDDMGKAMSGDKEMIMMGGGNPGHIPKFQEVLRKRLLNICDDEKSFRRLVGIYNPPQGELDFIKALADLLQREYGWPIGPENIALTNGSQTGFFLLFNMFAGDFPDGAQKKIRLPLTPEYIGYADIGLRDDFFIASRPKIEILDEQFYKYHVNFDQIQPGEETGAICVSRPTNPTGNVVTDAEIAGLDALAKNHGVPLIIDNAYGVPFPGIVFSEAAPIWNDNIIVCLSLSKLGMPAVRTGIIIADQEVIAAVSGMNAIMSLAPGNFGALLAQEMVRSHIRWYPAPLHCGRFEQAVVTNNGIVKIDANMHGGLIGHNAPSNLSRIIFPTPALLKRSLIVCAIFPSADSPVNVRA